MQLASFKGTHLGMRGWFNRAVRWWLSGSYSHTAIVFSDGLSGTSTWLDGGVQLTKFDFDPNDWDLIDLSPLNFDEARARSWFESRIGGRYDIRGLFGFVWRRGTNTRNAWFCSEARAESLDFLQAWRLDPVELPLVLTRFLTATSCVS